MTKNRDTKFLEKSAGEGSWSQHSSCREPDPFVPFCGLGMGGTCLRRHGNSQRAGTTEPQTELRGSWPTALWMAFPLSLHLPLRLSESLTTRVLRNSPPRRLLCIPLKGLAGTAGLKESRLHQRGRKQSGQHFLVEGTSDIPGCEVAQRRGSQPR